MTQVEIPKANLLYGANIQEIRLGYDELFDPGERGAEEASAQKAYVHY